MFVEFDVVFRSVVSRVEVVGVRGVFSSEGINSFHEGGDSECFSVSSNGVFVGRSGDEVGNLAIRETHSFRLLHQFVVDCSEVGRSFESLVHLNDVVELVEEPAIDFGQLVDLVDGIVEVEHGVGDGEETSVGGNGEGVVEILRLDVSLETGPSRIDLSNRLLKTLLESSSNRHHFSDTLHRRTNFTVDVLELGEIPLGNLGDDVIEGGFEASRGGLGDGVGEFGEGMAESDLGGGVGEGVSSCF